ncbi:hypothetical protein ADK75_14330 [Streptomyces virginiae]|uniref:Uncharacterized protein n=1 Tax=Streptomyces virginiae TaxID=1961 RepID=A0A0L8MUE3_STRVG|nr:hypothetical protein ADK75_14330 [Streptomyces virginiae]
MAVGVEPLCMAPDGIAHRWETVPAFWASSEAGSLGAEVLATETGDRLRGPHAISRPPVACCLPFS